jgi:hypothetical protein
MITLILLGLFLVTLHFGKKHSEDIFDDYIQVKPNGKAFFIRILIVLLGIRLFQYMTLGAVPSHSTITILSLLNPLQLLTVFMEELGVMLPILLCYNLIVKKKTESPLIPICVIVFLIGMFSLGYIWQGVGGCIFALFYTLYSTIQSRKYGMLPVMILHVVFDLSLYTILYLKYTKS